MVSWAESPWKAREEVQSLNIGYELYLTGILQLYSKKSVMQTESGSDWLSYIKQTLSNLGFANVWITPTLIHKGSFLAKLEQRSRDQFVINRKTKILQTI